jgi:hypothetical protein
MLFNIFINILFAMEIVQKLTSIKPVFPLLVELTIHFILKIFNQTVNPNLALPVLNFLGVTSTFHTIIIFVIVDWWRVNLVL